MMKTQPWIHPHIRACEHNVPIGDYCAECTNDSIKKSMRALRRKLRKIFNPPTPSPEGK